MAQKTKTNPKGAGRKSVMTKDVLAKLEQAFAWGCTNKEACVWAGISVDALIDYEHKNPNFAKHKELLRETPNLKARQVLNIALAQKDKQTAQWWLERKRKDEFSTRAEVVQPEPIKVFVTKEEQQEADDIISIVVKPRQ